MGRKNNRAEQDFEPLVETARDLGISPPKNGKVYRLETRTERDNRLHAEFERRRQRSNARADERISRAVDWDTCCIPGCQENLRPKWKPEPTYSGAIEGPPSPPPEVSKKLPVCMRHEVMISNKVQPQLASDDYWRVRTRMARLYVEADLADAGRRTVSQPQIYFVRLNDLIKVGWSSQLSARIKSYGASAEVLCHYPASRADETLLHRQLRPYLAKGREWYQDCQLIQDVVAGIIKRHGEPTVKAYWTRPKDPVIAGKRHAS